MMIRTLILFLFVFQSAWAGLTLWKPTGYDHYFVLPENVTPQKFLQFAKAHPQNAKYVQDLKLSKQDQILVVTKLTEGSQKLNLLIANAPGDHHIQQTRIRNFTDHLKGSFVLPLGAAGPLPIQEREKFYSEVIKNFKMLNPMGGDDVSPEAYNEKVTWAEGFDMYRDQLEIELLQFFYKNSKEGKIFGICRGMQITCVALGGKLNQDLIQDLDIKEDHKNGAYHEIYLTGPIDHSGTQFLSGFTDWKGNSWHHQSLNKNSLKNTPLEVIAESIEGVVEAAASRDNRILLLQSHPEKSDPTTGQAERFFNRLEEWVDQPGTPHCQAVLKTSL